MPLLRTAMYAKGIQIYCAPTADARDTWAATMRHIAVRGPLLRALRQPVRPPQRLPGRLPARRHRRRRRRSSAAAASCIVRRSARSSPGRTYDGEAILRAELDLGADRPRQVRPRRRRPLRAARHLPPHGRRAGSACGRVRRSGALRWIGGEENSSQTRRSGSGTSSAVSAAAVSRRSPGRQRSRGRNTSAASGRRRAPAACMRIVVRSSAGSLYQAVP